jgi:hemerythrin
MTNILWKQSFELGIPEIDIQHKVLFNILKILIDSVKENREEEVISGILNELERYTIYHTISEESFFGMGDNFKEHKLEHDRFKEDISGFRIMYENKSDNEFIEMMILYLQAWIENHVTGMDRRDLLENKLN